MTTHPGATQYAVQLDTPRKISLSGVATGSTDFDGSEDVTIEVALKPQPPIADLTAAPTMADFNKLLAALRSAGLIESGS